MSETETVPFEAFCILEILGHRRLAGRVSEQQIAGDMFLRIDIPTPQGTEITQYYAPSSVYCLTPTTEEIARAVALRNQPQPVHRFELSTPEPDEPF
jgi:hypothetical protein